MFYSGSCGCARASQTWPANHTLYNTKMVQHLDSKRVLPSAPLVAGVPSKTRLESSMGRCYKKKKMLNKKTRPLFIHPFIHFIIRFQAFLLENAMNGTALVQVRCSADVIPYAQGCGLS